MHSTGGRGQNPGLPPSQGLSSLSYRIRFPVACSPFQPMTLIFLAASNGPSTVEGVEGPFSPAVPTDWWSEHFPGRLKMYVQAPDGQGRV